MKKRLIAMEEGEQFDDPYEGVSRHYQVLVPWPGVSNARMAHAVVQPLFSATPVINTWGENEYTIVTAAESSPAPGWYKLDDVIYLVVNYDYVIKFSEGKQSDPRRDIDLTRATPVRGVCVSRLLKNIEPGTVTNLGKMLFDFRHENVDYVLLDTCVRALKAYPADMSVTIGDWQRRAGQFYQKQNGEVVFCRETERETSIRNFAPLVEWIPKA